MTQVELGMNRTGIATAGELSNEMIEGTREFPPTTLGDEREISRVRNDYAKDADPVGSVPPPASLKGVMKTAKQALQGKHPTQFIDKLGERLAFERAGVRLYEALLAKYDTYGPFEGGPRREDIEHILLQELEHFRMLFGALGAAGADPTVVTPSADLQATMTQGILAVLVDPRTNLAQGLEAMLVAELVDHDCWTALAQLADRADEGDLVVRFRQAELHEREHLARLRAWVAMAQDRPVAGVGEATIGGI